MLQVLMVRAELCGVALCGNLQQKKKKRAGSMAGLYLYPGGARDKCH
jgi:hypothetical protein